MAYLPPYTVLAAQEGAAQSFKKRQILQIYIWAIFPQFWALQLVELKQMSNSYRLFQKNKGF